MDLEQIERALIAAARKDAPSQAVPYAFEKRVMARLRAGLAEDPWAFWSRALWRAAAPCVALTMLLGAWSMFEPEAGTEEPDLLQQFDHTVLAAAAQDSAIETQ